MTETADARAHVGRRLVGIGIDWVLCLLISSAFFVDSGFDLEAATWPERVLLAGAPFAALGVWAVQHLVLVATLGATAGHALLGLRVISADGAPTVGLRAVTRTLLLALVIPAVVWGPDGRGLHDRAAGTRIVLRKGTS
ncbi:RDD family protein [Demequina pelophila]|uniref:RDD family protein n=1 Tax=Demequina pelophila TaxID=1638984 RepID=UPI00078494E3|nr:RDD family protein [Demequina pelophila]